MAIQNDIIKMLDLPHVFQETVNYTPVTSAAWVCIDWDDDRFIYMLFSTTNFWRYDTWANTFQQLANPTGTFGAGTCIRYTSAFGTQLNGVVYGSLYAIVSSGTGAPVFQRYDVANNTWTTLNVTSFAATFGTDGSILFPWPALNNYEAYHSGVLQTITVSASAVQWATTISVSALPIALIIGTVLNFGTRASPKWAVLTAAAAASATSITVAPLQVALTGTETARYYNNLYVVGNASTQMYRFQINTATWSTTTANAGNAALPVIPAAVWAWVWLRWVPWVAWYTDKLICIRWAGANNIYAYDLVANTWASITYTPNTETFTTWASSWVVINKTTGKATRLIISANTYTNSNTRLLELDILKWRINPLTTLVLAQNGTAVVGDKLTFMESPDEVTVAYQLLHTSTSLLRDSSIDFLTV